jgi:hypothetical protein
MNIKCISFCTNIQFLLILINLLMAKMNEYQLLVTGIDPFKETPLEGIVTMQLIFR